MGRTEGSVDLFGAGACLAVVGPMKTVERPRRLFAAPYYDLVLAAARLA